MAEGSAIKVKHLPQSILQFSATTQEALLIPEEGIDFDREMENTELAYLHAALRRTEGNKAAAARLLRVNQQRMKYLCRKHHVGIG